MKGAIACENHVRGGQQNGELVLVVGMLVADLVSVVQEMPAVHLLDQWQLPQRSGRVIPGKQEVDLLAVMNRSDLDRRLPRAVEISAPAGGHIDRWRQSPRSE